MNTGQRFRRYMRRPPGFTLIEVLLAVGLATALLVIALVFYRQAAGLRTQIVQASEQLGAVRLTLDRLVADLRTAVPHPTVSFVGGPSTLEFARLAPEGFPPTPIRVSLSTPTGQDGTNVVVRGLQRNEQSLALRSTQPVTIAPSPGSGGFLSTNAPADPGTNRPPAPPPLIEGIRFVRFRFWNGAAWQESWLAASPPAAVEISVGAEPLPPDVTPENYPYELFRRIVLIPAGRNPDPVTETNSIPALAEPPSAP